MISKFRAWYTPFKGEKYGQKMKYGSAGSLITHAEMSPDKYILMQSTGLNDKNGVEIFEGDIVRHSQLITDISIVRFGEFGVPNVEDQSYQDCAIGFYYENASEFKDIEPFNMTVPLNSDYVKDVLVIGNIYENPELLTMQEAD